MLSTESLLVATIMFGCPPFNIKLSWLCIAICNLWWISKCQIWI